MSVVNVVEEWKGRQTSTLVTNDVTETRHTRIFRVRTDNRHDADLDILFAATLPQIGSVHPADSIAFCRNQSAVPEANSPFLWSVRILYSTAFETQENPLDDSVRITWNTQQYQTPFIVDRNGNAVVNSAGDPFDPPAEKDDSRWTVSVQANVAAVPAAILSFRNAINSSAFVIDGIPVAAQHAFMSSLSVGEVQSRNGTAYRSFSYAVQLKDSAEGAWIISIADLGFYQIVGGVRREIKVTAGDDAGEKYTVPQQLNGSGVAVANPNTGTVVFRDFDAFNLLDFNGLPGTS